MRRAVVVLAVFFAACSSGTGQSLRSEGVASTGAVTTSGAEEASTTTTVTPAGGGTTTTLEGGPTTTIIHTTSSAGPATTSTTAGGPTTTVEPATTTSIPGATTTTTQPPTTTTTKALETVTALTTKGSCTVLERHGVQVAMNMDKLAADLAGRGYKMRSDFQFRDRNGDAQAPPAERGAEFAQKDWNQCAADAGGPAKLTLFPDGTEGSRLFADLVKGQVDALALKNYGGTTVA